MIKLMYMSGDIKDKVNIVLLDLLLDFDYEYHPEEDRLKLGTDTSISLLLILAESFKIFLSKDRWFLWETTSNVFNCCII